MNSYSSKHESGFWSGFFLGSIFGALVFFVLSTEEGQKKAKKILKHAGEFLEELEEKAPELKEYWEEKQESVNRLGKRFFHKDGKKLATEKFT